MVWTDAEDVRVRSLEGTVKESLQIAKRIERALVGDSDLGSDGLVGRITRLEEIVADLKDDLTNRRAVNHFVTAAVGLAGALIGLAVGIYTALH